MSREALLAPLGYAGSQSEVTDFASFVRPALEQVLFVSTEDRADACWIPVSDPSEAQRVVDGIILDRRLVHAARLAPLPAEFIRQVGDARQTYWDLVTASRQDWIKAGSQTTAPIAQQLSHARETFKDMVRRKFPAVGIPARGIDLVRGGYSSYQETIRAGVVAKIRKGQAADVIESAFRTNKNVDRFSKLAVASRPLLKALSVGSVLVAAVELPGHVSAMLRAQSAAEYDRAFSSAVDASSSASIVSVCLLLGVGTAGLGLLACGVAPVLAGFYGGDAALVVRDLIK